ncbi:MAG: T9SS type A sorting domain-containing protein [Bacteroidia bacterium]|nr:T9SS type A sorting domain-containing protein [Bacteroidia bacterium]
MKKVLLLFVIVLAGISISLAQFSMTTIGTPVTEDFQAFDASGCSHTPITGQLDSKSFALYGFFTGSGATAVPNDLPFNDTAFIGDLARGFRTAPVTIAGLYAYYDSATMERMMWVQPTGGDFTPGEIWMRACNNTGVTLTDVEVGFDLNYFNDGPRSQSISFEYSTDSVNFFPLYSDTTIAVADTLLHLNSLIFNVSGLSLADGQCMFFRWTTDDHSGAGARDELGIDNIMVTAMPVSSTPVVSLGINNITLAENAGTYGYYVNISTPGNCQVDLVFSGSATLASDYNILGSTTITLDSVNQSVLTGVDIIDDLLAEATEDIVVTLQNPVGCTIGTPSTSTISITDNDSQPTSDIEFPVATATVGEGVGTAVMTINQTTALPCSVEVAITGGTALNPQDFTFTSPALVVFDGIATTQTVNIPVVDDLLSEGNETVSFALQNISGAGCSLTANNFLTVTIQDNDLPLYSIGTVTTQDANGSPDSLNVFCRLSGIVHGVNYRASNNGLQFVIADTSGSIWTFNNNKNFGYTVTEGDRVGIQGQIIQFNGLTQVRVDTIVKLGAGLPLMPAMTVSSFVEADEADLLKLEMVKMVDPAQWTGTGPGFNVRVTNNVDTFTVRIDNDINLYTMPAPTCEWMNVRGLLSQFDSSIPYTSGYQLQPRYDMDIECLASPELSFASQTDTKLENAGAVTVYINIVNANPDPTNVTVTATGTATNGTDYTLGSTSVSFPSSSVAALPVTITITDDALVEGNETVILTLTNPDNNATISNGTFTLTIEDNDNISITPVLDEKSVSLYPNPGNASFSVKTQELVQSVKVISLLGKEVLQTKNTVVNTADLSVGVYFIQVQTENGVWNGRWIKE